MPPPPGNPTRGSTGQDDNWMPVQGGAWVKVGGATQLCQTHAEINGAAPNWSAAGFSEDQPLVCCQNPAPSPAPNYVLGRPGAPSCPYGTDAVDETDCAAAALAVMPSGGHWCRLQRMHHHPSGLCPS